MKVILNFYIMLRKKYKLASRGWFHSCQELELLAIQFAKRCHSKRSFNGNIILALHISKEHQQYMLFEGSMLYKNLS